MKDKLTCFKCEKPISGARVVVTIDGVERWLCGPCLYLHENPGAESTPVKRPRAAPLQEEKLVDVPPLEKESKRERLAREERERYEAAR